MAWWHLGEPNPIGAVLARLQKREPRFADPES